MKTCVRVNCGGAWRPNRAEDRGTVLLLVVAVLALLAVIGTVYIVSAKTERESSAAMSATMNLKWARDGVMQQVVDLMAERMTDAAGDVGGYALTDPKDNTNPYGTLPALDYDFPGTTEPWLAANLHNQNAASVNNYSTLAANAFDPSNGKYDLPLTAATIANLPAGLNTTVGDQTASDGSDDSTTGLADSYVYLAPFSDASGIRYRYYVRIIDTNRMANLNTGAVNDSGLNDTFGVWLDSLRLAPTSAWPNSVAYFNSGDQGRATALHQSSPATGLGRAGLSTSNAAFSLSTWQQQVLRLEEPSDSAIAPFDLSDELELRTYGEFGDSFHSRFAVGNGGNYSVWPNTLSANPGSPTSGAATGNPPRRNYTTYSYDRDLRAYSDPATRLTLTPADGLGFPAGWTNGTNIWPATPARIAANIPPTVQLNGPSSNDAMFYTAMAATNIATIMQYSTGSAIQYPGGVPAPGGPAPYTNDEACAFAANYCTARWDGFTIDPSFPPNVRAYYLPAGPSFVDTTGICIRSATTVNPPFSHREFGGGAADLKAQSANQVYLGYSAQPFISEVAAYEGDDDTGKTHPLPYTVVSDCAVELYNPYPVNLSLSGYVLKSADGATSIPLSTNASPHYIPANGYFVITSSAHYDSTLSTTAAQKMTDPSLTVSITGGKFYLCRTYYDRSLTAQLAPVDQIDYTPLTVRNEDLPGPPATPVKIPSWAANGNNPIYGEFDIFRPGGNGTGRWSPVVNLATYTRAGGTTLGVDNGGTATFTLPLLDRYAPLQGTPPTQGAALGMGEFARIMRVSNEFSNASSATPAPLMLISDHLAQLMATTAPYNNMVMTTQGTTADAIDSQILFDFYGDPHFYASVPPTDPVIPNGDHDLRAVQLLDQIALLDRYSDPQISIGTTSNDINKIRLPGRINVNTASGDVLRAIPNMTDQMVANIIAYRNRSSYNYNGTASTTTYSQANYPGMGIRSLAELLVPLASTSAVSIDQRDLLWGPICNLCTVRSDTFVVYGYLEALKVNPSYTGNHDNGASWYGAATDSAISTGANDTTNIPNLRVARERWVAIVDRSWCNYGKVHPPLLPTGAADPQAGQVDTRFALPRIVAIKDLPQ